MMKVPVLLLAVTLASCHTNICDLPSGDQAICAWAEARQIPPQVLSYNCNETGDCIVEFLFLNDDIEFVHLTCIEEKCALEVTR